MRNNTQRKSQLPKIEPDLGNIRDCSPEYWKLSERQRIEHRHLFNEAARVAEEREALTGEIAIALAYAGLRMEDDRRSRGMKIEPRSRAISGYGAAAAHIREAVEAFKRVADKTPYCTHPLCNPRSIDWLGLTLRAHRDHGTTQIVLEHRDGTEFQVA